MGPFEVIVLSGIGSMIGTIIAIMLINQFKTNLAVDDLLDEEYEDVFSDMAETDVV